MLSTVKNLFGEFMNAMIKKLLQGQAVEWRALGEVAKKISSSGTPKTGIPEYIIMAKSLGFVPKKLILMIFMTQA